MQRNFSCSVNKIRGAIILVILMLNTGIGNHFSIFQAFFTKITKLQQIINLF